MDEVRENETILRETPLINNSGKPSIRNIGIQQLNYGYIVNIGCHSFAFETSEKLIQKLTAYINCPDKVEQDWKAGTFLR